LNIALILGMESAGIQILRYTSSIKVIDYPSADPAGMRWQIRILSGVRIIFSSGKFLIYASRFSRRRERLKTVGRAVVRVAERLGVDIEVYSRRNVLSIFVYYMNENNGEIPVYCDWGKTLNEEDVYHSIRSVVYALSFHPKYEVLQTIRKR
jgi:hypothetical protein